MEWLGYWRLVGVPRPGRAERLGRLVGVRVLRIPGIRRVLVVAGSADRLRDLLVLPASLVTAGAAVIVVAYWRAPRRGWSGGIGPLEHLCRHRVALPGRGRGIATVSVRLSRPTQLREVLRAALDALAPGRSLPAPAGPSLTSQGTLPAYLPSGGAVLLGELVDSTEIRAHDVLLREPGSTGTVPATPPYAVGWHTTRHGLQTPDAAPAVLVDARRINPRGRSPDCYLPNAPRVRLDFTPAARRFRPGSGPYPLDGPGVTAPVLGTLRRTGVVVCPRVPDDEPVAVAALLVQIAMTGAVLSTPTLPERVAELIAPELRALLTGPLPETGALAVEARSIRQRRAALRGHATAFALPRLASAVFPQVGPAPSVSAILTTRRPERLPAAVRMLVAQTYPELEIVLCLHGVELPEPVRATLAGSGRPYEIVQVPGSVSFGAALGAATHRARGSLVSKFDDDDSYAAEHVWDLVLARHYSGATLVGKGSEFVHLEHRGVTLRRPSGAAEADCEVVAGGTILIARGDLEAVGGWRPVPRSVDFGLLDRVRRDGGGIYRTHPLGYVYHRRDTGHTWDPGENYFLDSAVACWPGLPGEVLGEVPGEVPGEAADAPSVRPAPDQRTGPAGKSRL
ncbi:glycosyltransferase [Plantactinospora endophytica]|uniref:glycosyltransferase n=1 Tax=Plantactinospora endophytica TaxID=673535 RepID=UPI001941157B|nr:glycosyltransferase [Plantactinospora endophytica]